jgi:1-acyl-sn-glycerol-3-phosphate acyltransferase
VSNHASWIDSLYLLYQHDAVLTTSDQVKNVPILGRLMQAIGAIFITRKGDNSYTKGSSQSAVSSIKNHQTLVDEG